MALLLALVSPITQTRYIIAQLLDFATSTLFSPNLRHFYAVGAGAFGAVAGAVRTGNGLYKARSRSGGQGLGSDPGV